MVRLVCVEGSSSKFWEAEVVGKTLRVRWGRIGTEGQTKDKPFANAASAKVEHDKLIREKTGKGYVEQRREGGKPASLAKPARAPARSAVPASATRTARFQPFTDVGTTVLFDASHFASIVSDEDWEEEFVDYTRSDQRHLRAGRMAVLSSGSDGIFDVELRVEGSLTAAEKACVAERYHSVFESKGTVFVGGLEYVRRKPDRNATKRFDLAPGRWSVTTYELEAEQPMPTSVALLTPKSAAKGEAPSKAAKKAAPTAKARRRA